MAKSTTKKTEHNAILSKLGWKNTPDDTKYIDIWTKGKTVTIFDRITHNTYTGSIDNKDEAIKSCLEQRTSIIKIIGIKSTITKADAEAELGLIKLTE